VGPDIVLAVDVGYLWNDVGEALRTIEEAAQYDLIFFETPFPVDALEAYARLTARTTVPIAVGEHAVTRWEFQQLMDQGGVAVVQPYMTTCGGLRICQEISESFGFSSLRSNGIVPLAVEGVPL
jgi:L-alanine-DL-glutamate epimerase-like enolase superfamily enzyme